MTSFQTLSTRLDGVAVRPGDAGFDEARAGVQRAYPHQPSVVVRAGGADDVRLAVRYAAERGLDVAVQATGHGLNAPTDGGVLIDTSRMTEVRVDPVARTARVAAGTRWDRVIAAGAEYGLVPLSGSSPDVGVVGYTLGGGLGLFGREFGYAADHVRAIDLVTADGEYRSVRPGDDLFWALRGGGGNFGVVTGMEFGLFPVDRFFGGGLFFDTDLVPVALMAYRDWVATVPDQMTTSIGLIPLPDVPVVPEPLRGRYVAHLRIAYLGSAEAGERLVAPLRAVGPPLLDTLGEMEYPASAAIYNEPRHPRAFYCANASLSTFHPSVPGTLLDLVGPDSGVVAVTQLNHLGGRLAGPPAVPNAVSHRNAAVALRVITLPGDSGRDAAYPTARAVTRAVGPWSLGRSPSFVQGERTAFQSARECYGPDTYTRLAALKAVYDPDNVFRRNVNIPPAASGDEPSRIAR